MSLYINSINDSEVLSSYNFARNSDVVFAEMVTQEQYRLLRNENTKIIEETENSVLYIHTKFNLKENDIIFTNSYFLEYLFEKLRGVNFKNIKIISSQTDLTINKNIFKNKPRSVSYIFSTNVSFEHKYLQPIPLGLANLYSSKNLHKKDFINLLKKDNQINKIYVNFEVNTNYFHRSKIKKNVNGENIFIEKNKLDNKNYLNNLNNFKFVLCPWGNGIDSHRIWETLYAGSHPIIPFHYNFQSIFQSSKYLFKDVGSICSNDFENTLQEKIENNNMILNINYWLDMVKSKNFESNISGDNIVISSYSESLKIYNHKKKNEYKTKKLSTFFRKIHNKVFN